MKCNVYYVESSSCSLVRAIRANRVNRVKSLVARWVRLPTQKGIPVSSGVELFDLREKKSFVCEKQRRSTGGLTPPKPVDGHGEWSNECHDKRAEGIKDDRLQS